ncbi:hypothetical protein Uis1B_2211 [Bifidobacterium margollesii]|uniref:Uncharacterized protein n=1 Tax=Bifidobacterium margollesii TaxID=2020964 RepID=A0A2N5J6W6_9BIFI|nr:hypothetical protein [Bifidobacterium margollesii]PLS29943.1 hypothetical protein Uis1B_2211 [Bifidobacterium margollesii]
MRIINCHLDEDGNNPAMNLAGRDAYRETIGFGEWHGHPVAVIAEGRGRIIVGWAPGYVRGAKPFHEEKVEEYIDEAEGRDR